MDQGGRHPVRQHLGGRPVVRLVVPRAAGHRRGHRGQPIFSVRVSDRSAGPEPEPLPAAGILAGGTGTVAASGRRIRLVTEQLLLWV
jgi:hypothetical protein